MNKNFISDQLTPRLKKGTEITLEILNMSSTKTAQNPAKYIWQLKRDNISFSVKWTVITKVYGSPNPHLRKICLTEKLSIINFIDDGNMLKQVQTFEKAFIKEC